MTVESQSISAEQLFELSGEGKHYELVRGELDVVAPAGHKHGYITMEIGSSLARHVRENRFGRVYAAETGFKLASNPDTVLAPDVAFVSTERLQNVDTTTAYLLVAPDLVVEVLSPSDLNSKIAEKVAMWLEHHTSLVIVIDPHLHTATLYRSRTDANILTRTDTLDGGEVVPGWQLSLDTLFSAL
ncbi:MAG: Uma2 family endonuclease [Trueperaceae bacterium]|nr:Uma2 family endonuclease [Trueperaceae bacterium]